MSLELAIAMGGFGVDWIAISSSCQGLFMAFKAEAFMYRTSDRHGLPDILCDAEGFHPYRRMRDTIAAVRRALLNSFFIVAIA